MIAQHKKNHRIIVIIFAMTLVPFMIAYLSLRFGFVPEATRNHGQFITPPLSTCQNEATATTCQTQLQGFDTFSGTNLSELPGHWLLVNVIPNEHCNEICLKAILDTRQIRIMLNRDLPRTRRVVMILKDPPSERAGEWWLKDALLWQLNSEMGKTEAQKKSDALRYKALLAENTNVDALIQEVIDQTNKQKTGGILKSVAEVKAELPSELIRVKPNAPLLKKLTELKKGEIPDGMLFLIDPLGNIMMQYPPGFNPYEVKEDLMQLLKASQIG